MLHESDVKELIYLIVINVKFFEIYESLDALNLFKFASGKV